MRDGEDETDSACRQPGRLHYRRGCPVAFENIKVQHGFAELKAQVAIKCHDLKPSSKYPLQGHPFPMAWLPGTNIYAAAALSHIWIIDGWQSTKLTCWEHHDLALQPVTSLKHIATGKPDKHSFYHGEPSGCLAQSFSPDRSSLAWVEGSHYTIVSFGLVVADQDETGSL